MSATLPATSTNGATVAEGSPKGAALLQGNVTDAATAVGVVLDNAQRLTTSGALALAVCNGGTSVLSVTKDGKLVPQTVATTKTAGAATCGSAALDSSGTVTIATTAVTANSLIFLNRTLAGGTEGTLYAALAADITGGTSFIIRSYSSGTTAATSDTSTIAWFIVN